MDRREFLRAAAAAGVVSAFGGVESHGDASLPRRPLGKTGERLSIVGMGGVVVIGMEQNVANRTVRDAIGRGVNYFDVAPSYGNGEAEEKLGAALKGHRGRVFLACKTGRRDAAGAREELAESLERLQTDRVDLYQLHGLMKVEDADKALAKGGAIEAFVEAKKQGKVRFLGFSAHSMDAALSAMERFEFDTVLFPINWVCYFKGNFGPQVVKAAQAKNMGILALKAMARCPRPKGAEPDYPKCWYQPETDPETAALALRFALSEPITAAIPPGDERLFEPGLATAERFKLISKDERASLQKLAQNVEPLFSHSGS